MTVVAFVLTTAAQSVVIHCLRSGVHEVHIFEKSLDNANFDTVVPPKGCSQD